MSDSSAVGERSAQFAKDEEIVPFGRREQLVGMGRRCRSIAIRMISANLQEFISDHRPQESTMTTTEPQQTAPQGAQMSVEFVDHPDLAETFADSIQNIFFDG